MDRPQAFTTTISVSNIIARCRRGARFLCIRWWNSCPGSRANKSFGYSKAGRAVVVEVLAIELIKNWVKHNSLLVDGDNRVGWD
jgi:hypothetical protein